MAGTFSNIFATEPDSNDATVPVSVLFDRPEDQPQDDGASQSAQRFRASEDDESSSDVGRPGAPFGQPEPYTDGGSPDGDAGSF